ncbi:hypothetical protein AK812_SmicGene10243 [Symbiodinium microadriaticum]|uniref:Uncharacterized protein n=1 Tax=Symbiodinium microadriaticum TaxID=2951 RepID=A0A1Q9EGB9_SYMMI|nr:hypothetical protein AK812_SmicGene10243 [Symbiodinium microadriaticum]
MNAVQYLVMSPAASASTLSLDVFVLPTVAKYLSHLPAAKACRDLGFNAQGGKDTGWVELRTTSSGVIFKFRPLTAKEDSFDSLEEGGLEFVVEARIGSTGCSYGWKVTPKENSERALVDKFQKDWAKVSEK